MSASGFNAVFGAKRGLATRDTLASADPSEQALARIAALKDELAGGEIAAALALVNHYRPAPNAAIAELGNAVALAALDQAFARRSHLRYLQLAGAALGLCSGLAQSLAVEEEITERPLLHILAGREDGDWLESETLCKRISVRRCQTPVWRGAWNNSAAFTQCPHCAELASQAPRPDELADPAIWQPLEGDDLAEQRRWSEDFALERVEDHLLRDGPLSDEALEKLAARASINGFAAAVADKLAAEGRDCWQRMPKLRERWNVRPGEYLAGLEAWCWEDAINCLIEDLEGRMLPPRAGDKLADRLWEHLRPAS